MPIYASAFFIPTSASIPYILEDIYLKGGYRSVATIVDRDAIKTAARKQGMLCFVREDSNIYWLPDTVVAGADAWKKFDVTKFVNFTWKDPLQMNVGTDGKFNVSIDDKRIVPIIEAGDEGYVLLATADGPEWQKFDALPSRTNAQKGWALILDANKDLIWGPVTGLPPTDGVSEGSAVVLGPDGPAWGAVSGSKASVDLSTTFASIPAGSTGAAILALPSRTGMVLRLAVDQPDVLISINSSSGYNDTNPYAFRSAAAMLEDDGTSVAENGDVSRQRRYAFLSALSKTDPKVYITAKNEGASPITVKLSLTVLPME